MKKVIFAAAVLFCATAVNVNAQSTKTNSKEYNVYYAQDAPYVDDQANNAKMVALENKFRAYAKAYEKSDSKTMNSLKPEILQWRNDNNSWISQLDDTHISYIDNWLNVAFKNLRLNDNK